MTDKTADTERSEEPADAVSSADDAAVTEGDLRQRFEDAGVTVSDEDGFVVITSDADDVVEVYEVSDGRLVVVVNGTQIELNEEQSTNLRIKTGRGDDVVTVGDNVRQGITVDAGPGNDTITGGPGDDHLRGGDGNDEIRGLAGMDRLEGQGGNDRIFGSDGNDHLLGGDGHDYLDGGDGDDQLDGAHGIDSGYGGAGDDLLSGGVGQDYLEGGIGDDQLDGGEGVDVVSGGEGSDQLTSGSGNGIVLTGTGADRVTAGSGDRVNATHQAQIDGAAVTVGRVDPMVIPTNIKVEGTPAFQARIRSDLQAMLFTVEGQKVLSGIGISSHTVCIVESADKRSVMSRKKSDAPFLKPDGSPGKGLDVKIRIRTDLPGAFYVGPGDSINAPLKRKVPPIVILFHELVHAEQAVNGRLEPGTTNERNGETGELTGREKHKAWDGGNATKNRELDAIGLEFIQDRNQDGIPDEDPRPIPHPTENSFRAELGIKPRSEY